MGNPEERFFRKNPSGFLGKHLGMTTESTGASRKKWMGNLGETENGEFTTFVKLRDFVARGGGGGYLFWLVQSGTVVDQLRQVPP